MPCSRGTSSARGTPPRGREPQTMRDSGTTLGRPSARLSMPNPLAFLPSEVIRLPSVMLNTTTTTYSHHTATSLHPLTTKDATHSSRLPRRCPYIRFRFQQALAFDVLAVAENHTPSARFPTRTVAVLRSSSSSSFTIIASYYWLLSRTRLEPSTSANCLIVSTLTSCPRHPLFDIRTASQQAHQLHSSCRRPSRRHPSLLLTVTPAPGPPSSLGKQLPPVFSTYLERMPPMFRAA